MDMVHLIACNVYCTNSFILKVLIVVIYKKKKKDIVVYLPSTKYFMICNIYTSQCCQTSLFLTRSVCCQMKKIKKKQGSTGTLTHMVGNNQKFIF